MAVVECICLKSDLTHQK